MTARCRRPRWGEGFYVLDVFFLILTVIFFVACLAYIVACERL